MPSSICSRCFCRRSWDTDQYRTCDGCRLGRRFSKKTLKTVDLQAKIPSSSTSYPAESSSASIPTPIIQTPNICQRSRTKRRRFNADISLPGKLF